MFTGIIEEMGHIQSRREKKEGLEISVATSFSDLSLGESVAVNGICLTVAKLPLPHNPVFFVSPETLKLTNLSHVKEGDSLNLERALKLGGRLSGHIVQGHVDGMARVISISAVTPSSPETSYEVVIQAPKDLEPYCIHKGSITLNGVSLTISNLESTPENFMISLHIIPHTWRQTTFQYLTPQSLINMEVDVISKYIERLCQTYPKPSKP